MSNMLKFYINGEWVDPVRPAVLDVIDPSTEQPFAQISMGSAGDINRAVAAAKTAFPAFSMTTKAERLALLRRILEVFQRRQEEIGTIISREMGAPLEMAISDQAESGAAHIAQMIETLENFEFTHMQGTTQVAHEPVGVVAMITPWNWPINQIACKVAPAIAAGCTMVLKPSEVAPLNALLFAEIMHEAGVPKGVFNLVNGDGPSAGQVLSEHPDVDMVSFTGSTRAGVIVAQVAAPTVKRVHQELGGKSPNIILRNADLEKAVRGGVARCFNNSGQSCNAPTRMFVPLERMDDTIGIAAKAAERFKVGAPSDPATVLGPVVSKAQYDKIQTLIESGIEEGPNWWREARAGHRTSIAAIMCARRFSPACNPTCASPARRFSVPFCRSSDMRRKTKPWNWPMTRSMALPPISNRAIWTRPVLWRNVCGSAMSTSTRPRGTRRRLSADTSNRAMVANMAFSACANFSRSRVSSATQHDDAAYSAPSSWSGLNRPSMPER